jgi:hypothetical protein
VDYDPGDIVLFSSQEGTGGGSVEVPVRIQSTQYDPKTKTCTMEALGLVGLLINKIELDLDDFPTIDVLLADNDPDIMRLS